MLNFSPLAIVDFETTGVGPGKQPAELACCVIDPRRLEIKENGIFTSLCAIIPDEDVEQYGLDKTDDKALEVAGLNREILDTAPALKQVFATFSTFLSYHNPSGNAYDAPILCCHNLHFDKELMDNICDGLHRGKIVLPNKLPAKASMKDMSHEDIIKVYQSIKPLKEPWGFQKKALFNKVYAIDTLQDAFMWFENSKTPDKLNQTSLREFLGFSTANAHGALCDVLYTAEILVRYLKLHRQLTSETDFSTDDNTVLPINKIMENLGRTVK